jgi:hypothetical protein
VKTIVDQRRRAVLPFKPGDVLSVEKQSADIVVLKRMKPAQPPKPKLVRIKGELFSAGGVSVSNEDVRRMIEDEP